MIESFSIIILDHCQNEAPDPADLLLMPVDGSVRTNSCNERPSTHDAAEADSSDVAHVGGTEMLANDASVG